MAISGQFMSRRRECPIEYPEPQWASWITPGLEFNARAVRARAGLLNIIIACAIAALQVNPEADIIVYIILLLLFDLGASVFFGLTPYSPLGMVATILTRAYEPQWTPHLPKRFAWTMGAGLAITCLFLQWLEVQGVWLSAVLWVFFILTWLDAAVGFCVGCWIYSKLFGCRSCRIG